MQDDARVRRDWACRAAVLAGEEAAWRVWYDEAFEPLRAFVFWRLGRQSAGVEEVIQETWLIAVRRIKDFDPRHGAFLDWLRGIAVNVIRNRLRERPTTSLPLESVVDRTMQNSQSRNDVADRSERIAVALSALPEQYSAVLTAKYFEQQSVSEIAQTWNQTVKAIESLLTRARLAFREAFGEES